MATSKRKKRDSFYAEHYINMSTQELNEEYKKISTQEMILEEKRKAHEKVLADNKETRSDLTFFDYALPVTGCGLLFTVALFNPLLTIAASIFSFFYLESKFKFVSTLFHKIARSRIRKKEIKEETKKAILEKYIREKENYSREAEELTNNSQRQQDDEREVVTPSTEEEVVLDDEEVIDNNSVVTPTTTTIKNDNEDEEEVEVEVITPNSTSTTGLEADADTLSALYHSSRDSSSDVGHVPSSQDTDDGGRSM